MHQAAAILHLLAIIVIASASEAISSVTEIASRAAQEGRIAMTEKDGAGHWEAQRRAGIALYMILTITEMNARLEKL